MSHSHRSHSHGRSPKVPVARPYAAPPSRGRLLKVVAFLLFAGACTAVGAFVLPKLDQRPEQPTEPVVGAMPQAAPQTQGKSLAQLALEEADKAQEQEEMAMAAKGGAAYTGVKTPDKLDEYTVAVPDAPAEARTPTRPAQEKVVVPQLTGTGAAEVSAAVDKDIDRTLAEAKIPASTLADDAEFLRRVYLDLTGRIPTYEQTLAFFSSKDPYKRSKLIDEILASEAFGHHVAAFWTDLLIKRDFDNNKGLKPEKFETWLAEQFNKGEPWNKIVHTLLTAEGKESENAAVFFYLANQENNQPAANKLVGATGNLFMGIQIQCAECHVHPFTSKWKPTDFWGMAAFFGHTRAEREGADKKGKGGIANIKEIDSDKEMKKDKKNKAPAIPTGATIAIPDPTNAKKTVGTATAKFFESSSPKLGDKGPYRPPLADWVTSSKNHYFAPAMVNRTWSLFFARGFVNPVDDMKDSNKPSHPVALKLLADEFVKSGYDVKFLVRCICNTQAYQRTSRPLKDNAEDETLFSHMPIKVMNADMLLDSLEVATSNHMNKGGGGGQMAKGGGKRGGGGGNLRNFFDVNEYGDDPRDYAYGIPHILKMINTNVTNSAYEAAARIVRGGGSNKTKIIDEIYLTVLARRPSADENKRMQQFVAKQGEGRGYGGVFWALLNSAEFVCNR